MTADFENLIGRVLSIQGEAAEAGFDWPDIEPMWQKLDEEIRELRHSVEHNEPGRRVEEELGDILFMTVNLARRLNCDPVAALEGCVQRFRSRYAYVQKCLSERPAGAGEATLEEMEAYWQRAKLRPPEVD